MAIQPGIHLGPYEILSAIGAGGMGEVYRARDTRLDRIVAIKVLPIHLADRPELRERFEREARTVAGLNHPHICTLFDVGHQDGTDYLVMEYLEGETLAQRLLKGPLPPKQVLQYAIEIADALDKAHRKGVTHRDLKPGNIMLTKSGAKLLDFGLAKLQQEVAPTNIQVSQGPTMNQPLTGQGAIVGTLQYMAPEQLEGKEVDARTDIFAFGTVVYEMATGNRAFEGKSQASVIAKILETDPPPISSLQPMTPPALDRVVKKCLAKEPDDRWQSARDVADELKWIAAGGSQAGLAPTAAAEGISARWRSVLPWAVAAAFVIGFAVFGWLYLRVVNIPTPSAGVQRFELAAPQRNSTLAQTFRGSVISLSPESTLLVFFGSDAGGTAQLWIRRMDSLDAHPLDGTGGVDGFPFWSPDSRSVAFWASGKLKKLDIASGSVQELCDSGPVLGGFWTHDGRIIFSEVSGSMPDLFEVSASGGAASLFRGVTRPSGGGANLSPVLLPDGHHFVYLSGHANGSIYLASLDAKPGQQITARTLTHYSSSGVGPPGLTFAPSLDDPNVGYLLFTRVDSSGSGSLLAQALDLGKLELTGEPIPIAEGVSFGGFSASASGVLAYRAIRGAGESQLTWFNRQGKVLSTAPEQALYYGTPALSPDGTRAAVTRSQNASFAGSLWLIDFSRGTTTRFTFGSATAEYPIWSPDGKRIVFSSNPGGVYDIYQKPADGSAEEELLLKSNEAKYPSSISRDGRFLLYFAHDPKTQYDLWVLPLTGDKKPFPFLQTEFNELDGHFSPDGHWVAYESGESGRDEIYVRKFSPGSTATASESGAKWQVSYQGGGEPRWSTDGKELYYVTPDSTVMAVDVTTSPTFQAGTPKLLFQAPRDSHTPGEYTIDGKRFFFVAPVETTAPPFTVVLNWQAGLKQ